MTLRQKMGTIGRRILNSRLGKRLPLFNLNAVRQIAEDAVLVQKMRRSIIRQRYVDVVDQIIDQPQPYSLLKNYANRHPFLRIVHGAIIREVLRNGWDVIEKFAKKCVACGQEFKEPVEECPDCGPQALLRDPNPQEKIVLQNFLKHPNRDDKTIDILKSLLKDNLSVDDWYLSISKKEGDVVRVYNEDSSEMFLCADEHARLGNGVWFCPSCWKAGEDERIYNDAGHCPDCDGLLKETAYVQKHEGTVKARYGRDDIIHGNSDPWLPKQYGNSKVMAVLMELRASLAMDSRNLDIYTKGVIDKLVALKGEEQKKADEIAGAVKEQREAVTIDAYTGRVGRKSGGSLFLGTREGVDVHDLLPDAEKMRSLEWMEFWFVKVVGGIYGVQPIMMNTNVSTAGGYFQRMQIIVQNDTTRENQKEIEDPINEQLLPVLGVRDWMFKFNEIEPRNEMEDAQIWQSKVAAGTMAVEAGLKAEITDEGELKISGEFEKPEMPSRASGYIMPKPPKPVEPKMPQPFSQEKMKKGKSFLVTEVDVDSTEDSHSSDKGS